MSRIFDEVYICCPLERMDLVNCSLANIPRPQHHKKCAYGVNAFLGRPKSPGALDGDLITPTEFFGQGTSNLTFEANHRVATIFETGSLLTYSYLKRSMQADEVRELHCQETKKLCTVVGRWLGYEEFVIPATIDKSNLDDYLDKIDQINHETQLKVLDQSVLGTSFYTIFKGLRHYLGIEDQAVTPGSYQQL